MNIIDNSLENRILLLSLFEFLADEINQNWNNEENELEAIDFIEPKIQNSSPKITWKHVWTFDKTQNALLNPRFIDMPSEIMLKIFGLLSVRDLGNVSLVCRYFKMIAYQDTLWKRKCNISNKLNFKSYKQIYIDWIYQKYLRNKELETLEKNYQTMKTSCELKYSPSQYIVQSISNESFPPSSQFNQHLNSSPDMTIQLSVDFDKTAREFLTLLEKTSRFKNKWCKSMILKQMIRRYYRFMILKVLYPNNFLISTIDIEIVWQTHLLRPLIYQNDCLRLFGQIIDHSLLLNHIQQHFKQEAFLDTCHLYEKHFHEQYCSSLYKNDKISSSKYIHPYFDRLEYVIPIYSYWDETYFQFSSYSPYNYENPFSFTEADIILDANWINLCKYFMNCMLLKGHTDVWDFNPSNLINLKLSSIKQLKKSYERFLYMSAKYASTKQCNFIHPTYAIDLIWHCHLQEPLNYAKDCNRLFGWIVDHYPWPSIPKYRIKQSYEDLNLYWEKEFQNDMSTDHLRND